ncbi:LLM class flavin-dependent oxidoreductase [Streptomyces xiamenensis]|uniref:LLM class flavin-dependent oxidoreductase n=1 Tax=Streptomyces xiamenensis TaxID=408015 RepID=UPI00342C6BF0
MNYGHALRFGLHLPTDADCGAGRLVAVAGLAEQWGLDLLVVPAGTAGDDLEPSTVASWIAAATVSLGLVLEAGPATLHPAMLARAVASLDRLTEGRAELAFRAGPPTAASGTADSVAPAHDVPISVDGQGQDLLRLVGLRADEWSTGCDAVTLTQGNRAVDEAAQGAGRDPREIRGRVTIRGGFGERTGKFTGTATDWVNDLLPLVVEHGVGTIVLDTVERDVAAGFASEVAPALRAAAEAVLPRGWSGARVRRSAVRARRRPGIDYEGAPPEMAEVAEPGIILWAATNEQVTQALPFARRHPGVALSRRSAGHGVSGRSTNDGGIVIDVSLMNAIEVLDRKTRRVRIGPGARWAEVAGANFGIVTAFEFEADDVGAVAFARLTQDASDLERCLVEWGRAVEDSPRDLTSFVIVPPPRGGRPALAVSRTMVESSDPETVRARLDPLAAISAMYAQDIVITSYAAVMDNASDDPPVSHGEPISRSGLLRHVPPQFAAAAARVIRSGAVADAPSAATAYAHRDANFSLVVMGGADEVVDRTWARLSPFLDGLCISFDSSLRPERIAAAWPPRTLSRLRELKSVYDPEGVLGDNFALTHAANHPGGGTP